MYWHSICWVPATVQRHWEHTNVKAWLVVLQYSKEDRCVNCALQILCGTTGCQKRGLYTTNIGTEEKVVNSTWEVGTVLRKLQRCASKSKCHAEGCCEGWLTERMMGSPGYDTFRPPWGPLPVNSSAGWTPQNAIRNSRPTQINFSSSSLQPTPSNWLINLLFK